MGGAIGEGNRTPAAEFNIWADPEAAHRVFVERDRHDDGRPRRHAPGADHRRAHRAACAPRARSGKVVAELMDFYARFHKARYPDLAGSPMHDPVCVAHVVDPTLVDVRDARIEVDCGPGPSWGRTNVDWRGREHFGAPNAKVGARHRRRALRRARRRADQLAGLIVFAAIAPHGGQVFDQPEAPTRKGMEELGRRFAAARPTAVIVLTPHGLHIDDHFAVVRSLAPRGRRGAVERCDASATTGRASPELAEECVAALQGDGPAGARNHVRLDGRGSLDDAARLGRDDPALVHARARRRRHAVPRAVEQRARPGRRCARPGDRAAPGRADRERRPRPRPHRRRPVRLRRRVRAVRRA